MNMNYMNNIYNLMNIFFVWKMVHYNKQYDQGCNKHLEFLICNVKAFNPLH